MDFQHLSSTSILPVLNQDHELLDSILNEPIPYKGVISKDLLPKLNFDDLINQEINSFDAVDYLNLDVPLCFQELNDNINEDSNQIQKSEKKQKIEKKSKSKIKKNENINAGKKKRMRRSKLTAEQRNEKNRLSAKLCREKKKEIH